ncbi:MAG: deoxycytidylate deaminase, partial [Promethearchaeota archaeon]
ELNCIIQAALHGTSIEGNTIMYSTTFPCMSCLKVIINAGIKKIVYKEGYYMDNKVKEDLIRESDIKIIKFEDME